MTGEISTVIQYVDYPELLFIGGVVGVMGAAGLALRLFHSPKRANREGES